MTKFPFYKQFDTMDCGPTCLKMVAKFYGRNFSLNTLRTLCETNKAGVSLLGLSKAAEKLGLRSLAAKLNVMQVKNVELPIIIHWRQKHFVVLIRVKGKKFTVADPARGIFTLAEGEFKKYFVSDVINDSGIALLINTTPEFFKLNNENDNNLKWSIIFSYLTRHKKLITQLLLGLLIGTLLQLIAPFLTQSIVDVGINTHNIKFIYIILIAQISLTIGRSSVDFIRSWILFHVSTRINLSILTDFLIKLMKLPLSFFEVKMTGDIMQRMSDQTRIESFLTGNTLNIMFSLVNLVVFSFVLIHYNSSIFFVFCASSISLTLWVSAFLGTRKSMDYQRFNTSTENQNSLFELINGMQEIKLNNCEQQKRWAWEHVQAKLFKLNIKTLTLRQYQSAGSILINEASNIFITFLSAKSVIEGKMTLGGMLAIQYIVGQLNNPISQLLSFITSFQDAKISLERLNEIHLTDDEEPKGQNFDNFLPPDKTITFENVSFKYPGAGNELVLKNIDLTFPEGKTTAIVGMSGSGKTTLLKMLMRYYKPLKGNVLIDTSRLDSIDFKVWRDSCGTVTQEGFIFHDTIGNNIGVGDQYINMEKLHKAIKIANIQDFIDNLPLGINTKIGTGGNGISQGQKQRILIARAVYKSPDYLLLDEATNALDANNERVIMDNLLEFFQGRTVVIVAHRLSTVKNADSIVVLDKGEVIEQGTHKELTTLKGKYYNLVKNQLELGL